MTTTCTRCEGSGFLNAEQLPDDMDVFEVGHDAVLAWVNSDTDHDVAVCDCCGDTESWHGSPGEHYGSDDPPGNDGPYAYNGGLSECH